MSESGQARWVKGFKADYDNLLFVSKWSSYMGVALLVLVILGLMINGMVWGVFGGVKFWGDWINNLLSAWVRRWVYLNDLDGFLTHRMSLMNTTLVLGAFLCCPAGAPVCTQSPAQARIRVGRWWVAASWALVQRWPAAAPPVVFLTRCCILHPQAGPCG
jgi:hypothetical protein